MPDFIRDYRPAKRPRNAAPLDRDSYDVWAVWQDEAKEFFGCRDTAELVRHVRGLHRLGLLLRTHRGEYTAKVRVGRGGYPRRAYLLLCPPDEVPRRRRRRSGRVYTW